MLKQILLDEKEFHFTTENLPMLIHGEDKSGASLLTVSAVADLHLQGAKMLFLSGYPMAREEFLKQTEINDDYALVTNQLNPASLQKRVLFLTKEYRDQFVSLIHSLADIQDRIILIKNIDLFDEDLFTAVSNKSKIIYSGDLNKTVFKEKLLALSFKTQIFFSPFKDTIIPPLAKYQGYMINAQNNGLLTLATI